MKNIKFVKQIRQNKLTSDICKCSNHNSNHVIIYFMKSPD